MVSSRKVVLFVAEAVTLAHYGRIATLARALPSSEYRVIVAAHPRFRTLDEIAGVEFEPVWSISSDRFSRALARGAPLYDAETLTRYVEDDLALIDRVKPDLVVGDFRLSLAVSAPLRGVPYASIVNAYWSPYADIAYPVPELPFTRLTGLKAAQTLFNLVRPLAFARHASPLNHVRQNYGLAPLGSDLRETYAWADYTLYADIPELIGVKHLPGNHRFLGAVLWSAQRPLPEWWDELPEDRPTVFLTLGSSGRADLLPEIVKVLADFPVNTMVATAGNAQLRQLPFNVWAADFLPADAATARSALILCNGGSLTTYQALAAGIPAVGVCSNMDQLLNMKAVEARGAGMLLRAGRAGVNDIRAAVRAILDRPEFGEAARTLGRAVLKHDSRQNFQNVVAEILHRSNRSV